MRSRHNNKDKLRRTLESNRKERKVEEESAFDGKKTMSLSVEEDKQGESTIDS
jgi:hypothetical protein